MTRPYLDGVHTPVDDERTLSDLSVRGVIPADLQGVFARNSGNPHFPPQGRYHWFDGDGMVHALAFQDGRASYRNRWLRTAAWKAEEQAGKALWRGILEPVDMANPHGPVKDTANTDLTWWRGRLVATWWLSGRPLLVDADTLETCGSLDFDGALRGTVAAHPKVDPWTGELVFFGYSILRKPYYFYGVANADGSLARYQPVDLPRPHVPHDIAITRNYSILMDLPLGWDLKALAAGKRRIGFDRSLPARFGIIPRHGDSSEITWFDAESCYVYHSVVAWEEGRKVHLVGCRIADPIPGRDADLSGKARLDNILLHPFLHRWTFDLDTGAVQEAQLDDVPTEFPRIHDGFMGRPARFSWSPRVSPDADLAFDAVRKVDLHDGSWQTRAWPDGWRSGEVVFAPRPGAVDEDDGWVITILSHPDHGHSLGIVLDGRDPLGDAVAEITIPRRVPAGFHAEWAPRT